MADRCKYCGAKKTDDGWCSRPCAKGELDRKVAEDKEAVQAEKEKSEG